MRPGSGLQKSARASRGPAPYELRYKVRTKPYELYASRNDLTNTWSNLNCTIQSGARGTVESPRTIAVGVADAMPRREQLGPGSNSKGGHVPGAAVARCSKLAARWNCFVPYSRGGSSSSSLSLPPSLWDGNAAAASLAIA